MRYQVKAIYVNNAPNVYGVFPTVDTGTPFVRFGTPPTSTHATEPEANYAADVLAHPRYPNGTPRSTWEKLSDVARETWK